MKFARADVPNSFCICCREGSWDGIAMSFEFFSPTRIIFGRGSLEKLTHIAPNFGKKALLLFGRSFARKYGYVEKLRSMLESKGLTVYVREGIEPNPSIDLCNSIAKEYRDMDIELIVAFGGGSVIDAAKAIAAALATNRDIRELLYPKTIDINTIPIIAIPTTCGTGSEVTRYAILTDSQNRKKVAMVGYGIVPRIALVDPNVLRHLSRDLIIWTALDAFSHAIESYIAKSSSHISEALALKAMELILRHLSPAIHGEEYSLERLHIAATIAGLAINVTGTTLTHAMSYYLTTHHGVHHGLATAVLLPYTLEINLYALDSDRIDRLLSIFRVDTIKEVIKRISLILKELGVPQSLLELGVEKSEIDEFVRVTLSYKRNLEVNPIKVDENIVKQILEKAFSGYTQYL